MPPELLEHRREIGLRMRELRHQLYGGTGKRPRGARLMSQQVNCRQSTWQKYELGVACPAEVVLTLIVTTGVSPAWLLLRDGPMFAGIANGRTLLAAGRVFQVTDDE